MAIGDGALVVTVFVGCAVEAVEALTIVLAAGSGRDWRSAITGVGCALAALAAIVAVLGPAVTLIPISALRLVVGGLLLTFGLQWLRKAVLRAARLKAMHDEDAVLRPNAPPPAPHPPTATPSLGTGTHSPYRLRASSWRDWRWPSSW